jgi:hypothetical protein
MGAKIIHLKKIIRTVQRIVPQISLPQIQKLLFFLPPMLPRIAPLLKLFTKVPP